MTINCSSSIVHLVHVFDTAYHKGPIEDSNAVQQILENVEESACDVHSGLATICGHG